MLEISFFKYTVNNVWTVGGQQGRLYLANGFSRFSFRNLHVSPAYDLKGFMVYFWDYLAWPLKAKGWTLEASFLLDPRPCGPHPFLVRNFHSQLKLA